MLIRQAAGREVARRERGLLLVVGCGKASPAAGSRWRARTSSKHPDGENDTEAACTYECETQKEALGKVHFHGVPLRLPAISTFNCAPRFPRYRVELVFTRAQTTELPAR